ncbi:peroxisomal oxidase [Cyathus striatus]|nr:peroxisomal oxidase [Cyathus striatus]
MSNKHDVNAQTALDMTNARRNAAYNVSGLRDFLYGGQEKWVKKQRILQVLQNDPVFDKSRRDFMNRTERYTRGLAMINRVCELQEIHGWSQQETSSAFALIDEQLPVNLHNVAFEPVFLSQGGSTLVKKYGSLITHRAIFGCYLQTELGHGSNVSRLETTATYIPQTKEFEIHSPSLTSSKWWIGALGKTATHGVVQQNVGPHLFFVQLRSLEDHKVLPGYAPTDNGFARFDHVRIPKENMLSQFSSVTDDGKYIQPPHAKLSYGGMLYIRANMIADAGWRMAKAATVSIRYATVRRQGEKGPDGLERQVITYPSLYYRLLPILSHAYVFIQLGEALAQAFDALSARLKEGDTSLLAEMHATTSGLKVLASSTGVQDLELARRSMGGHGYSAFSGLGQLYADYLPSVTYEGDNFVLDQQVVRAALKSFRTLQSSRSCPVSSLSPSTYYLRLLNPHSSPPLPPTAEIWLTPATSILLLEWRAALLVREVAKNAEDPDASVNQRVAKGVTEAFVAVRVGEIIESVAKSELGKSEKERLGKVYLLYLLTTIEGGLVDLLSFGVLGASDSGSDVTRSLRIAIQRLCTEILPDAVSLSDAFGFSDWELDSALGVYNGKVYEALWERAQAEPLNQSEVPVAYKQSIKPILERGRRLAAINSRSKL